MSCSICITSSASSYFQADLPQSKIWNKTRRCKLIVHVLRVVTVLPEPCFDLTLDGKGCYPWPKMLTEADRSCQTFKQKKKLEDRRLVLQERLRPQRIFFCSLSRITTGLKVSHSPLLFISKSRNPTYSHSHSATLCWAVVPQMFYSKWPNVNVTHNLLTQWQCVHADILHIAACAAQYLPWLSS